MTSLSKNGRFAVFTSSATDVVPGSTTTNADVYRRDLLNNTTVQVTVRPNGAPSTGPGSSAADVSADGNLVAFNSYDTDLVPVDGNDQETDLFIRNMTTGKTRWLSAGFPAGMNPDGVVLSPNGQWVSSRWTNGSLNLDPGGHRRDVDCGDRQVCTAWLVLEPAGTVRFHFGRCAVRA